MRRFFRTTRAPKHPAKQVQGAAPQPEGQLQQEKLQESDVLPTPAVLPPPTAAVKEASANGAAAVIVGVSSSTGLGAAVAERFAKGGMRVGIIGRSQAKLDACRSAILSAAPSADVVAVVADATDEAQISSAFATLRAAHGAPAALVYNVSVYPFPLASVSDTTPARLESDWKSGPFGALLCVQQVLPAMVEARGGTIILTGASASMRGAARFGSFAVAKCGLRALAQSLAKEVLKDGVHVAHVVVDAVLDMEATGKSLMGADTPPGKLADPMAVADFYWALHAQKQRCFTFESDLRPFLSSWQ